MLVKTIDAQYNLLKFGLTTIESEDARTTVLEMLLDFPLEDFDETLFNNKILFVVINDGECYTFMNFVVNEFYAENEFLRVICTK